jgi:tryptophanyl-tRNA synthetase
METLFSGIRPTGDIHIGNYLGAVKNWVDLQDSYKSYFSIVDFHAVTTPFEPSEMQKLIKEMSTVIVACGVDPNKAVLFVQSHVPQHLELSWLLSTVTNFNWLTGMIQFKEKSEQHPEHINAALFSYPVLQAADIAIYKAKKVPVGEDQLQHIELARDVVRKFNYNYKQNVLIEPDAVITTAKRIQGLDGSAKMSKSLGNYISVIDPSDVLFQKLRPAVTDSARVRKSDAGDPNKCNVYTSYHTNFSDEETLKEVREGCTQATMGCIDCKKLLHKNMDKALTPIREKYHEISSQKGYIEEILNDGANKAKAIAIDTLNEVKGVMGLI